VANLRRRPWSFERSIDNAVVLVASSRSRILRFQPIKILSVPLLCHGVGARASEKKRLLFWPFRPKKKAIKKAISEVDVLNLRRKKQVDVLELRPFDSK
jgi:hypothetical protein